MTRNYFISVAMATYNGELYIKEQLESILNNLCKNDEVIISDDGSTDRTIEIIKSFNDKRIKIYKGPRKGIKQNFANAISKCNGKYIFLSDQDDIWDNKKIIKVLEIFNTNDKVKVIVHDCNVVNNNMEIINDSYYKIRNSKSGIIKNIWKNSYIGCCMAFDSSIKNKILPIPNNIEMHDQWIGIKAELIGDSIFIKEKLIKYRRHNTNVSELDKHHSLVRMIRNRFILVLEIIKRGK